MASRDASYTEASTLEVYVRDEHTSVTEFFMCLTTEPLYGCPKQPCASDTSLLDRQHIHRYLTVLGMSPRMFFTYLSTE